MFPHLLTPPPAATQKKTVFICICENITSDPLNLWKKFYFFLINFARWRCHCSCLQNYCCSVSYNTQLMDFFSFFLQKWRCGPSFELSPSFKSLHFIMHNKRKNQGPDWRMWICKQTSCYLVNSASPPQHCQGQINIWWSSPTPTAVQQPSTFFLIAVVFERGLIWKSDVETERW